ncbi:TPA: lichenicidin A2 family type 2 lantibiotic [Staphylococcus aureus]|nr:lichenicidin A2 family type 2 lantibiotic [Staphylococcus aureus]
MNNITDIEYTQVDLKNLVGNSFEEMSLEEMALTQGTGDVQPQSTPGCFFASLGIGVTISAWKC